MNSRLDKTIRVTQKQCNFINATADEVLFGGAAGGGKSFGQVVDIIIYALKYNGSSQLILRRTMPELERTLIRAALMLYPKEIYGYNKASHVGRFVNGSTIEFGYCGNENDVYRYQSAEYDVIRFDELTHFTEHMYLYLISRVRGANGFPKQLKSCTNPGGIGHAWVKRRFIDIGAENTVHHCETGSRVFLPARLYDNVFLMDRDAAYANRMKNLSKNEQRSLLDGEWDVLDGQYFSEWSRDLHVVKPFVIPNYFRRVFVMDYGLDMLAGFWIAISPSGFAFVYREVYEGNHIISNAARRILELGGEEISEYIAPPDLWNRRQDSGKSASDIFLENGIGLNKASSNRVAGWYAMKEMLKPIVDEHGRNSAKLVFFDCCINAIRCIPALVRDKDNPNDCAIQPHEVTHAPDAIRYFCAGYRSAEQLLENEDSVEFKGQLESLIRFNT